MGTEIQVEPDLIVYPNPSSDTIVFTVPTKFTAGTVVIYSIIGQKILEQNITPQASTVSLKQLSEGIYLYTLQADGFIKSGRIVKKL